MGRRVSEENEQMFCLRVRLSWEISALLPAATQPYSPFCDGGPGNCIFLPFQLSSLVLLGKDFLFLERQRGVLSKRLVLLMALLNLPLSYSPGKDKPQDPCKHEEQCQQHNHRNHSSTPRDRRLPCS